MDMVRARWGEGAHAKGKGRCDYIGGHLPDVGKGIGWRDDNGKGDGTGGSEEGGRYKGYERYGSAGRSAHGRAAEAAC